MASGMPKTADGMEAHDHEGGEGAGHRRDHLIVDSSFGTTRAQPNNRSRSDFRSPAK